MLVDGGTNPEVSFFLVIGNRNTAYELVVLNYTCTLRKKLHFLFLASLHMHMYMRLWYSHKRNEIKSSVFTSIIVFLYSHDPLTYQWIFSYVYILFHPKKLLVSRFSVSRINFNCHFCCKQFISPQKKKIQNYFRVL